MDVYLDNIIIYSKTLEEHMAHIKQVISILAKEKFYLAELAFLFQRSKFLATSSTTLAYG